MGSVLIIAFDGLDYELVDKFDCGYLKQSEFGKIDNHTNVNCIKTGELFASFITGKNYEEHGVKGAMSYNHPKVREIENIIGDTWLGKKTTGLRKALWSNIQSINAKRVMPYKEMLGTDTVFEEITNSKALNVPAYNKNAGLRAYSEALHYGIKNARREAQKEFEFRKKELFEEIEKPYTLLMAHFHYPDLIQHLYEDPDSSEIEKLYVAMNEFAEEIIEKNNRFNTVIFMSDHGMPTENAHNKNAFYSCNRELFGSETPHITNFYDKIKDITRQESEIDSIDI